MLIAATAILVTIAPALRRSFERARPSPPRGSHGMARSEDRAVPIVVGEDAPEPEPSSVDTDGGQPPDPWPGQRRVPGRWGRGEGSILSRRVMDRAEARKRGDGIDDESEMERLVREQLYGPGFRRR